MYHAPLASSIALRSYGAASTMDRHDFAQLVLPLSGQLDMDIAGHGARLNRHTAAFVEAGARHDQISTAANQSLIIDLSASELDTPTIERLARRPYLPLPATALPLIDYMGLSLRDAPLPPARLRLWLPLMLDALLGEAAPPRPRLQLLQSQVQAHLGEVWTVAAMAARLGVSSSRLHAIFQQELATTPRAWLAAQRLARARHLLEHTRLPLAELAAHCGYADQSALSRAIRKATGQPPGALRRQTVA